MSKELVDELNIQIVQLINVADYNNAKDVALQIIAIDKKNLNAYIYLGACCGALGEYDDAIKAFKNALLLDKSNFEASYGLATTYFAKKCQHKLFPF